MGEPSPWVRCAGLAVEAFAHNISLCTRESAEGDLTPTNDGFDVEYYGTGHHVRQSPDPSQFIGDSDFQLNFIDSDVV